MRPYLRPRPVDAPAVRLLALHHAGGSAAVYHPLARLLPADWDVVLPDLPGRGTRAREAPRTELTELVDVVLDQALAWSDEPLALFGHSLGAVVATELARRLEALGRSPMWLGVSGRVAPARQDEARQGLHRRSDAEVLATLGSMGGLPERLREIPEFTQRFLRTVRADLAAVDSYRPAPDRARLSCPLTVFGGRRDSWAPVDAIGDWGREARSDPARRLFPGGHFYFLGAEFPALASAIAAEVTAAAPRPGTRREAAA